METPSSNSLLKPRLRLLRRTPSPRVQDSSDMDFTPVAVPSSVRSQFNVADDEDDNQPTPRMPFKNIASSSNYYGQNSESAPSTSYAIPSDTPAARLRALIRSSDFPSGRSPPTRSFAQPSEAGTSSVSSRFTPATPSVIRDSLKDLFSHARREPGDTPQKSRPRRNSFDTSEMDITPVVDREREHHKGKRKSLSDDEVDKPKSSKGSESSFRSSHAATFDTLRARLMSSHSQLLDQNLPTAVYDVTSQPSETGSLLAHEPGVDEHATATSTLLRPLDSPWLSPPISAVSPHRTFQLPSQLVSHSNLLDQDSEMQHAMKDLDTSEDVPASTPGPSTSRPSTTPLRPRSSLSFRGSLRHHDQSRRASLELPGSRASSSLSDADFKEQQHSREEDRMHQREREWNRPKAPSRSVTPELHHRHSLEFHRRHSQELPWTSPSHVKSLSNGATISRSGSPLSGRNLHRRGSVASLRSFDDDQSSRPSSRSSQADYRDRISELDRDHHLEREREWNKRHPPPRPSSSLSSHSNHSHTHPIRPPSATAYSTPTLASLQREASSSRLSGASSPASSLASHDSSRDPEEQEEREVSHERERNWNSPQPKWNTTRHHSHGSSGNEATSASVHLSQGKSGRGLRASSSLPHVTPEAQRKGSPTVVRSHSHKDKVNSVDVPTSIPPHRAVPSSPSQTNGDKGEFSLNTSPLKGSAATSRFGWHFPRSRQLAPLDLEGSPERPGRSDKEPDSSHHHMRTISSPSPSPSSRPSSRASGVIKSSLIPVRSTSKRNGLFSSGNFAASTPKVNDEEKFKKGHRKRLTEFTESVGSIHPQTNLYGAFGDEDMVLASDEESVSEFAPRSTTPDTRPSNSFPDDAPSEAETEVLVSPPSSPPRRRSPVQSPPDVSSNDEARLQRALASTSATSFRPLTPDSPSKNSRAQERTTPPSFTPSGSPPSFTPLGTSPSSTPPATPPLANSTPQDESSKAIPTFALMTPPRRLSSSTSILDFRTPSPPHDLSNLSVLPSSSEDEVETREADVTPVRVDEDGLANPNYTAMKTPRPPGAWAATPIPPKHPRETSPPPTSSELTPTVPSSSTPLPRANSEPERSSKPEAPTSNGLLTPIPSLSRANSLPLRTPAPPGAWTLTPNQPTTQNGSADQSQFGSIGRRKSILKVRFDVTESEASTAEVEHQKSPLSSVRVSASDSLPNGHARWAESVPPRTTNGSAQVDAVHDPVPARPVTPERSAAPVSRANAPSPRSLRKSPSVKVVDAFGRERIDDLSTPIDTQDIPDRRVDAKDAIRPSSSAETPHTPRAPNKSNIRIVDAMGREIEEEVVPVIEPLFEEGSSVLHDDSPIGRTETLTQMRQTLREWADGLSDGDRSADDLALNTSHLEELEEVSRAARHARNQLAQTLRVESMKEHDLTHKYAKDAVGRSGLLPTIVGDNSSFHRGLVWFGVVVQIIFILAMWRFAHVQARRLFYTVYYDPLYPELNSLPGRAHQFSPPYPSFPWSLSSVYEIVKHEGWTALKAELQGTVRRIGEHAWERWGERPYAVGTWPPT